MQVELLLESFLEILRVSLAGVPISVAVFLFMEAFKASGIVDSGKAKRIVPIVLGILFAMLVQSITIVRENSLMPKVTGLRYLR